MLVVYIEVIATLTDELTHLPYWILIILSLLKTQKSFKKTNFVN